MYSVLLSMDEPALLIFKLLFDEETSVVARAYAEQAQSAQLKFILDCDKFENEAKETATTLFNTFMDTKNDKINDALREVFLEGCAVDF